MMSRFDNNLFLRVRSSNNKIGSRHNIYIHYCDGQYHELSRPSARISGGEQLAPPFGSKAEKSRALI